jgi:hypothetical protein
VLLGLALAAPRGDESELGAWDTSSQQDRHSDHRCNGMSLPVQTAAWKRSRQTGQRWSRGRLSAAPASQSDPSNRCLGKDRARVGLWITFCEGQAHKLSLLRGSCSRGCVQLWDLVSAWRGSGGATSGCHVLCASQGREAVLAVLEGEAIPGRKQIRSRHPWCKHGIIMAQVRLHQCRRVGLVSGFLGGGGRMTVQRAFHDADFVCA